MDLCKSTGGFLNVSLFRLSSLVFLNMTKGYLCNNIFRLHFLSWVPNRVVRPVHSIPLFGDDYVDSKVTISMAQWKHNPGVLVVYGIA